MLSPNQNMALEETVRSLFAEVFDTQNADAVIPALDDDTVLLDTGLDSLGFAILVTRLEEELDYDPFSLASDAFYPSTFKEFVDFYAANAPK
jgi:acyl carrier protein